jgi:hypothetical protein
MSSNEVNLQHILPWDVWTIIWGFSEPQVLAYLSAVSTEFHSRINAWIRSQILSLEPTALESNGWKFNAQTLSKLQSEERLLERLSDFIKLLNKKFGQVAIGKPLTNEQIQEFEEKHKIRLPREYKRFLLRVADGLFVSHVTANEPTL